MRLLFIKPKHIGDTLILTPTIVGARQAYPDAEIWVVVRRGCESILAGCPEIDRILMLSNVDKNERRASDTLREMAIFARLAATRFDYVFELGDGHRGRLFARAARTSRRYSILPDKPLQGAEARAFSGVAGDWRGVSRVIRDYRSVAEFLPLPEEIPPLRFVRELTRPWLPAAGLDNFAVLQVGARQGFNRWSLDGWRAVCARLLESVQSVIVTCGASAQETADANALCAEFGPRVLATRGTADWSQMADLLYRARLYVGSATAAMHLAAACACASVVLFGRGLENHWYPWRAPYRAVNTVSFAGIDAPEERAQLIRTRTMLDTPLPEVLAACDEMLAQGRAKS